MPNGVIVQERRRGAGTALAVAAAVGGGLLLLGGLGRPRPAAAAARAPARPAAPAGQAPVPTAPGVVVRTGNFSAFIPVPFEQVVSDIFSIFTPSRSEAAAATAGAAAPVPEHAVAETTEGQVTVGADGTILTASDFGFAGALFT